MQSAEFMVLREEGLRRSVKQIVEDWVDPDFYALEATREAWQGEPWTLEKHGPVAALWRRCTSSSWAIPGGRWDCP